MSTQQTPLAMALSKRKSDERATPLSAFRMARSWWLEGRRLNLSLLAEELGIGRATLMRWVGNKDLLMGEILWSLYKRIYDEAIARADQTPDLDGIDYLTQIYTDKHCLDQRQTHARLPASGAAVGPATTDITRVGPA